MTCAFSVLRPADESRNTPLVTLLRGVDVTILILSRLVLLRPAKRELSLEPLYATLVSSALLCNKIITILLINTRAVRGALSESERCFSRPWRPSRHIDYSGAYVALYGRTWRRSAFLSSCVSLVSCGPLTTLTTALAMEQSRVIHPRPAMVVRVHRVAGPTGSVPVEVPRLFALTSSNGQSATCFSPPACLPVQPCDLRCNAFRYSRPGSSGTFSSISSKLFIPTDPPNYSRRRAIA